MSSFRWQREWTATVLVGTVLLAGCAGMRGAVQRPMPTAGAATQPAEQPVPESIARLPNPVSEASIAPAATPASSVQPANFLAVATEPAPLPLPTPMPPVAGEIVAVPPQNLAALERPSLPIDFGTALALTQGQNPRVAFAQAQIWQAQAQYEAARVLWLPSIRGGMNYNKHEGRIQEVRGYNIETSRGAAYGGLGSAAVGAASPAIPGVYMQFHLTDAIHQPKIRSFGLAASKKLATAAMNDQLLETALAYLALLDATQKKAIAAETLEHAQELAKITESFAQTGAGNQADADRAAAALALLKNEVARADEATTVASARLAQQISGDPSMVLAPQETAVVPIDLNPPQMLLVDLVATGLSNRPELAASRSLVCEAVNRLRREQNAPWLPSVILGGSYGSFGAGLGGNITDGGPRFDFDGIAYWELRNLGFGERAARASANAQVQQARMREVEVLDLVAREVVETQTQVEARRGQIEIARSAIISAQQSYERNLNRIRNVQGLPIEVLQSIQALDQARREYLRTVVDYNQAQFRLHRALGWPVQALQ